MNTRSQSNKREVDDHFNLAIGRTKSQGPHTSTPVCSRVSVHKELTLDESTFSTSSIDTTIIPEERKSEVSIIMAQNPFVTLKYAVEAVPFFDGSNIPLNYFVEGCEEAKSMLPSEAESQFTKVIRTRIVGEARRTIQDQDFDTLAQLTRYLKQIYGPSKNVYQLQGELGSIYMKNEENVVTYANRVKMLGKQILEAYKNSGNIQPDHNIKQSLEKDMIKCFIRGLKPEIEQRINRNSDVQATIADALRIERELYDMTSLRQGVNGSQNSSPTQANCQLCHKEGHLAINCKKFTQNYNSDVGNEILICQICKKRGHSADKCRYRDPQSKQPVKVILPNTATCQICSKPGHSAKTCRFNNKTGSNSNDRVICQWCDKEGHSANNCWKKQNVGNNNSKVNCQLCNNFGHVAKECRSNLQIMDKSFCRYCKEQGHLLENCQLRIASNNRRKGNNAGNQNGPLELDVQQGTKQTTHPTTSQRTNQIITN